MIKTDIAFNGQHHISGVREISVGSDFAGVTFDAELPRSGERSYDSSRSETFCEFRCGWNDKIATSGQEI